MSNTRQLRGYCTRTRSIIMRTINYNCPTPMLGDIIRMHARTRLYTGTCCKQRKHKSCGRREQDGVPDKIPNTRTILYYTNYKNVDWIKL